MTRLVNKIILLLIILTTILLGIFFLVSPYICRINYIQKITKIEIPSTSRIIDYRIGFNLYDTKTFYAKIKISKSTNQLINNSLIKDKNYNNYIFEKIMQNYKTYTSFKITNVDEILRTNEILISKYSLFFSGSTRVVYYATAKEDNEDFYLYVFY